MSDLPEDEVRVQFNIRAMSPDDLARLGVSAIAYVKPMELNGVAVFTIHAADGTQVGVAQNRAVAFAAIVQHEMLPAYVQ